MSVTYLFGHNEWGVERESETKLGSAGQNVMNAVLCEGSDGC